MHSLRPSLTALGALAAVASGIPARALAERLHVDGQVLRDTRGGVRILRGVNVAGDAKVPPFRPVSDPAVFDRLAESGVNVVRLLFTWEAYEAERDHHAEGYLAYYAGLVGASAQWAFVAHPDPVAKDGWNREDFTLFDVSGAALSTQRVRAHVVRIAGEPVSFGREESPPALALVWRHDPARGETRVFVPPALLGGDALALSTTDDVGCAYEGDGRHLRCTSPSAGQKRIRLSACGGAAGCVDTAAPSSTDAGNPALSEGAGPADAQVAMVHDAALHDAAPRDASASSAQGGSVISGPTKVAAPAMPDGDLQTLPSIDAAEAEALPTPASARGANTQAGCSLGGPGHARIGLPWWLAAVLLWRRAFTGRARSRSRRGLWPR